MLIVFTIMLNCSCSSDDDGNSLNNNSISTVVKTMNSGTWRITKYIDSENHNDPIVILTSKQKINLWNFYDNVEVGDSLSKPKGTSIMEVYRNGKVQKLDFNIEFKKTGERTSH